VHELLAPGTALADILLDGFLPLALRFQDEFDCVAKGPVSAGVFGHIMCVAFYFVAGVGDCDRKAAIPHYWQINYIIADERRFRRTQRFFAENVAKYAQLVLNALMHKIELEVAGAESHGFGDSLCDQSGLDAAKPRERNASAIVRVKSLGFDEALAVKTEASLAAVHGCVILRASLRTGGNGEKEELAVGKDAVHVKEQELDLLGAGFRVRHGRILAEFVFTPTETL
jgi:hypothetical protein